VPSAHPIEGVWRPVRAELDGEAAPDLALERIELHLAAGRYAVRFAGELHDGGDYALAALDENGPARIVLTARQGHNQGRDIPAIFQLVGDRLRVCYGLAGATPDAFATTGGSRRYLVTYKRLPSPAHP